MTKEIIKETQLRDCPCCGQTHAIDIMTRTTQGLVKDEVVDYEETYYFCNNSDHEENEFVSAKMMDINLLNARDAYRRKKGLLTSEEIAEIRNLYDLTQKEFANLLGWGEITVTRYESKTIQDETYDYLMRMVRENPIFTLESLEKHGDKFTEEKYEKIRQKIIEMIEQGSTYYVEKEIQGKYVKYREDGEYNGYTSLDLEKVVAVINYYSAKMKDLYKVKLMKLLWYGDVLHFKRHGRGITGLVYQHMPYGALPLAHDEILKLPLVHTKEEIVCETMSYRIIPSKEADLCCLSSEELKTLDKVAKTFHKMNATQIIDYMHREEGYQKTEPYQLISFETAKNLRELK